MILLLNTTKMMDPQRPFPANPPAGEPVFQDEAAVLAEALGRLSRARLREQMALSEKLADQTRADLAQWGRPDRTRCPALFVFTGLVYKSLEADTLTTVQLKRAQHQLRILSGLYGLLRPMDLVEAYRLEMGARWQPPGAKTLLEFWREKITAELNATVKAGQALVSVAAQEYNKVLDRKQLTAPMITPVFKERRTDGSLKTVAVHAKKARGALVRFALTSGAKKPRDLLAFGDLGWEAATEPPVDGNWLFTRPAQG